MSVKAPSKNAPAEGKQSAVLLGINAYLLPFRSLSCVRKTRVSFHNPYTLGCSVVMQKSCGRVDPASIEQQH